MFDAKLKACRHKMFHIFHFLKSDLVFGIIKPFSLIFNAVSGEKSCPLSMPFQLRNIDIGTAQFSHLLNPDWSIQISGAQAVCKVI